MQTTQIQRTVKREREAMKFAALARKEEEMKVIRAACQSGQISPVEFVAEMNAAGERCHQAFLQARAA